MKTPVSTIILIDGTPTRITFDFDLFQGAVKSIIREANQEAEEKLLNAILNEVRQEPDIKSSGSAKAVVPGKEDPETCEHSHLAECIKAGTNDTYDFCLDCRSSFPKCPHHYLRKRISYEAYECLDCHELLFTEEEIDWDNAEIEEEF